MSRDIKTIQAFTDKADYSFIESLTPDPQASQEGEDFKSREVFNGHYVLVQPTPIEYPCYVAHSHAFFEELGLDDALAKSDAFMRIFSGDLSVVEPPMRKFGWATGYALSIYGTEYYEQCPFGSGNGYGDGRAITIFEGIFKDKRWQMQLKGGGTTPYCRGADGRAVLRSSVREFLAQEHMYALGIPTTRSLTLYASETETVKRPWFRPQTRSYDPNIMQLEPVAITTRVASSFLRVGQLELFGRRARKSEHEKAMSELEEIVRYAIKQEYGDEIDSTLPLKKQLLLFAKAFRKRLVHLVSEWIRVGYCQGNFNSDNCAIGGFTLDYGPFGFIDDFDPFYQPWTGGGRHFSFLNQPQAAQRNFTMFCSSLVPLFADDKEALSQLEEINQSFTPLMQISLEKMWASKLGMEDLNQELFRELVVLMQDTSVDYTIFFRELSTIPKSIEALKKSFYTSPDEALQTRWTNWLNAWHNHIDTTTQSYDEISKKMKSVNPKYTLREWHLVPAYEKADEGDYSLIYELQEVMQEPYNDQSKEIEEKYYAKKPTELFDIAGVSFVSCSS